MSWWENDRRNLTIGKFFLFGLEGGCEVEGIEDATRIANLIGRQAVALEDRVLVYASGVLNILPPSQLDVVEQYELDHKKGRWWSEVLRFTSIVPSRGIDESHLCEYFWQEHACNSQHGPSTIDELSLNEPL